MFINHRDRRVSLRRPPGARARAEGRAEELMAELAHTRRFLERSTSIDVSVQVCVCVCWSLVSKQKFYRPCRWGVSRLMMKLGNGSTNVHVIADLIVLGYIRVGISYTQLIDLLVYLCTGVCPCVCLSIVICY